MDANYVLIKSAHVTGIVKASEAFVDSLVSSNQIDSYVLLAAGVIPPIVGDNYVDGAFSTYLTKPQAITAKIAQLKAELQAWIELQYDLPTRLNFHTIYTMAAVTGKTNRAAYIQPLLAWAETLVSFTSTTSAALQAQSTADAVLAYAWDFSALASSNPKLNLMAAIQIAD